MVMEAKALEVRPIGHHEIRITRVYTVEAGEFAVKHDRTPNWSENRAPAGAVGSFHLRIEAEAGNLVNADNPSYVLDAKAVCLSNPDATSHHGFWNIPNLHFTFAAVAFTTDGWEYDSEGERYTRTWSIPFPQPASALYGRGAAPAAAWLTQINEIYQFFVTLIGVDDPTTGAKAVACSAISEPFLLL